MASTRPASWHVCPETVDIPSWRTLTEKTWPHFCSAYGCLNAPSFGGRIVKGEEQENMKELFVPLCSTCFKHKKKIELKPGFDSAEAAADAVAEDDDSLMKYL